MTISLEIRTMISKIMNLDFLKTPKDVILKKKEHFVPFVQIDDFASGVDNFIIWLVYEWFYSFVNVLYSFWSISSFSAF